MTTRFVTLVFGLTLLISASASALQPIPACDGDNPCPAGYFCDVAACLMMACAPDDENCDFDCPDSGTCVADNNGSQCTTDKECPQGFDCLLQTLGAPTCVDGEDCGEGEPITVGSCQPAACKADADCGGDLVCVTVTTEMCAFSQITCAAGEECESVEPKCETQEESFCAPKWLAPCEADVDCGDGFECQALEICACSGSTGGGTPTAPPISIDPDEPTDDEDGSDSTPDTKIDDETDDDTDDANCKCEPTGQNQCVPKDLDCNVDTDCPAEWTCVEKPTVSVVCISSSNGESTCDDIDRPAPETKCAPPDVEIWADALDEAGFSKETGSIARVDDKDPDSPMPSPGDGPGAANAEKRQEASGCQAGSGANGGWILALLALAFLVTRRRFAESL